MSLKLMYVTNRQDVALIAQNAGVDRIFIDMEYIGKDLRQGGMDTLQQKFTCDDIRNVKKVLTTTECIARCNPMHDEARDYCSSEEEIEGIVESGADIIMLPYFKTAKEVERFMRAVNSRTRTMLLVETPEAVENLNDILSVGGIDEIHIGINDLSLGYKKHFMFELLADGTVDKLCDVFRSRNMTYGFGGITSPGQGLLPAERVIAEHYRLGSTIAILSRGFCKVENTKSIEEVREIFDNGIKAIRDCERECANGMIDFASNRAEAIKCIDEIVRIIKEKKGIK